MRRVSLLVASVLVALSACGGGSTDPVSPPAPPPPPPPPNSVSVTSNSFTPSQLTASPGTTVTWNFQGGVHNVTFEDNQGSSADQSSGSHSRTFNNPGTFRYRCTIHSSSFTSGMTGSVQIQ